jgi:hypothetical protein
MINGRKLNIKPSLHSALHHIQTQYTEIDIWVDALCTLQEVAVSRSAILTCGSDYCNWELFVLAKAAWLMLRKPNRHQQLTNDQVRTLCSLRVDVEAAAITLQGSKFSNTDINLLGLMRHACKFNATDPRDKLYALLGMKSMVDVVIEPTYPDPVSKVYTDFVCAFLRDKRNLSFLAGAGTGIWQSEPSFNFPSWVPDLRGPLATIDDYRSFAAAGPTDTTVTFSADLCLLLAEGVIRDIIEDVNRRARADMLERNGWISLILSQNRHLYLNGMTRLQAYIRALIGDTSRHACRYEDFPDTDSAERFIYSAAGFLCFLIPFMQTEVKREGYSPGPAP